MTKQIFKVLALLVTLSFSPNVQSASYNYQEESWVEKDKNKQSKRNALIKSIMKTLGCVACIAAICVLGYKFVDKSGKKSDPKTTPETQPASAARTLTALEEAKARHARATAEVARELARAAEASIAEENRLERAARDARLPEFKETYAPLFEKIGKITDERIDAYGDFFFNINGVGGFIQFVIHTNNNSIYARSVNTQKYDINITDRNGKFFLPNGLLGPEEYYIWKNGQLINPSRELLAAA